MTDPRFIATARAVTALGPCLRSVQLLANLALPQLAEGFAREGDSESAAILREALERLQAHGADEAGATRPAGVM